MRLILFSYLIKIIHMLVKFRLDQEFLPKYLGFSRILPKKFSSLNAAEKFKLMLEQLGPLWVKFGQILSTRYDILPEEWIKALSELQDSVKPFSDDEALLILQQDIPDFKNQFVMQSGVLASASIAQVYAARHIGGQEVVLKVLRPGIKRAIKRDISCLAFVAKFFSMILRDAKRLHLQEIVAELDHSLQQEINLLAEAANASVFARNFLGDNRLFIPKVFWEYSSERVLVLERVSGCQISDIEHLKQDGVDLAKLAKLGIELFFTQVLRDSYFHADMHPGNIFVKDGSFMLVDFGIVGSLNAIDQRYIAENMLAFFKRDYRRVAVLHVESGWVPADTRIEHFEASIRQVCEPIFAKPLKDISFGQLFLQLLKTAREFKTEIQPQLLLLQKTLLQVEALGRMLDPELDLWQTVQPQVELWVNNQLGLEGFINKSKHNFPYILEKVPDLPGLIINYIQAQSKIKVDSGSSSPNFNIIPWTLLIISLVYICLDYLHC